MTEVKMYECDSCGFIDPQDDPNMEIQIKHCFICDKDFCDQGCQVDHAIEECGF